MRIEALVFVFSAIASKAVVAQRNLADYTVPRNCTEVYSVETPKYVPYEERYRQRQWFGWRWRTRTNYRLEKLLVHQRRAACCPGYAERGSACGPVCSRGCGPQGLCARPELCVCREGYRMEAGPARAECRPVCASQCPNGECVAPDVCACREGYRLLADRASCGPVCAGCAGLEYCVGPAVCRCILGYERASGSPDRREDEAAGAECRPVCEQECENGECVEPNRCRCLPGFEALEDDAFVCRAVCEPRCQNGLCVGPNECLCRPGYRSTGRQEAHLCRPFCSGGCVNAECVAPDTCSCYDGYAPTESEPDRVCRAYCSSPCEHGECVEPEVCSCDDGYEPLDNRTRCEPLCSLGCVMGNCTGPETCSCFEGYSPLSGEGSGHRCEPVCSKGCDNGLCTAPDECTCFDGYEMRNISDGRVGEHSACVVACDCENGFCDEASPTCKTCLPGYDLEILDNATSLCKAHCETGCPNGRCVEPRVCDCDEGYVAANDSRGNPSCSRACNGQCEHGACEPESNACSCLSGWAGQFCDEPTLCHLALANTDNDNDTLQLLLRNNSSYNETGETMMKEIWSSPSCNDQCWEELNNMTKCVTQSDGNVLNVTCLMSIDSPCNSYAIGSKQSSFYFKNYITMIIIIIILITTSAFLYFTIRTYILIKKRKMEKSIELIKSIQRMRKYEGANVIDSDGISL